jgi:conjugative transfer signal peptidase TraF
VSWIGRAAVCVGALCLAAACFGLRINTSDSAPNGLYIISREDAAPFIEFCPAEPFATQSRERGYRAFGIACPDRAMPLLKPVVASAGDIVLMSPAGIAVNGHVLPNTTPLGADGAGRPLKPWPSGTYRVNPGTVWVASTYNRGSYDSRYMGPIELRQIRRRLKPLWLWNQ